MKPILMALIAFATSAFAAPILYAVNTNNQFGTVDPTTGSFRQIAGDTGGLVGLAPGPNGSLFSLSFTGDLVSIDPATGQTQVVGISGPNGTTGFGIQTIDLAGLRGTLYGLDGSNKLYTINPSTGAATLIGPTGIPPFDINAVPQFLLDETLFGANGKLYATFDVERAADAQGDGPLTLIASPKLYQIDPVTGVATIVASTIAGFQAAAQVNGTVYAFRVVGDFNTNYTNAYTLDLSTGNTTFLSRVDTVNGFILGATAVPEPSSMMLAGLALAAVLIARQRRSPIQLDRSARISCREVSK